MAQIQCSFYSPALKKNAAVTVFLPTTSADDYLMGAKVDYNKKNGVYQTLYLLHGSYGGCSDWTHFTGIERYAQEKCLAVVMPSAENSLYVNMNQGEGYLTYLSQELPQFLERIFPLGRRRENRFIAGLSMGGYGAFRCALERPDLFSAAASLSGALDVQAMQNSTAPHMLKMSPSYRKAVFADSSAVAGTRDDLPVLLKQQLQAGKQLPHLYFCCGTEDFIFPQNESFYAAAKKLAVQVEFAQFAGIHDWNFWDTHIQDVLSWLDCKGELVEE